MKKSKLSHGFTFFNGAAYFLRISYDLHKFGQPLRVLNTQELQRDHTHKKKVVGRELLYMDKLLFLFLFVLALVLHVNGFSYIT